MKVGITIAELSACGGLGETGVMAGEAERILTAVVLAVRERRVYGDEEILEVSAMHAVACAAVAVIHRAVHHGRCGERVHRGDRAVVGCLYRFIVTGEADFSLSAAEHRGML